MTFFVVGLLPSSLSCITLESFHSSAGKRYSLGESGVSQSKNYNCLRVADVIHGLILPEAAANFSSLLTFVAEDYFVVDLAPNPYFYTNPDLYYDYTRKDQEQSL